MASVNVRDAMPAIVLTTLNARYSHASLGLRCLRANLGELRESSEIAEFTLRTPVAQVVERLLALAPRIVGFGVYIWNVRQTEAVVRLLKQRAPQVTVVLGGPEVSHEVEQQPICRAADYTITGWGEVSFAALARQILHGPRPLMKVHAGVQPPLADLALPYGEFSAAACSRSMRCGGAARAASSTSTAPSTSRSRPRCASCSSFSIGCRRVRTIRRSCTSS